DAGVATPADESARHGSESVDDISSLSGIGLSSEILSCVMEPHVATGVLAWPPTRRGFSLRVRSPRHIAQEIKHRGWQNSGVRHEMHRAFDPRHFSVSFWGCR